MLTQCPNCDTTFRVTSEILRVAQGQVRCGRCDTQFDALERLIEEDELAAEDPDATAEVNQLDDEDMQLSEPDLDAEEPQFEEEEEQEQEGETQAEEWVEFDDIEAESSLPEEEQEPADEEAVEEDTQAQSLADEEVDYEQEAVEQFEPDEDETAIAAASAGTLSRSFTERRNSLQPSSARLAPRFEDTDQFEINRRPLRIPSLPLWNYLVVPLVVLFAFQVFNHYRAPLARHPRFGGVVSGIYRLLGVDLVPDWNLRAYELKSYRVATDPSTPGTLRVRATVRNGALFPQPYPLLKLILLDRFTEPVRAREFEPIEYLDKPPLPNALLGPRNEFTANFAIVDPGPDAPGFRFDICLRGNNGPVCIDDLPVQMASK